MGIGKILGVSEVTKNPAWLLATYIAELYGTGILTLLGTSSAATILSPGADATRISLTFGWCVIVLISLFGGISGGHFNPAVTISMMATSQVPIIRGILYIFAQICGGVCGCALIKALSPFECQSYVNKCGFGVTQVSKHISLPQGFAIEVLLGFFLLLILCGVSDPIPNRKVALHTPTAVGAAIFVGHLGSMDYTGSSMNPARSLAAAMVFTANYDNIWIYLVGPTLGGLMAAFLYKYVLAGKPIDENIDGTELPGPK